MTLVVIIVVIIVITMSTVNDCVDGRRIMMRVVWRGNEQSEIGRPAQQ